MSNVEARQTENGQEFALQVYNYEQLAQEERNRQIAVAVLTGVAAGANAYSLQGLVTTMPIRRSLHRAVASTKAVSPTAYLNAPRLLLYFRSVRWIAVWRNSPRPTKGAALATAAPVPCLIIRAVARGCGLLRFCRALFSPR
jgi:hypothetical protein